MILSRQNLEANGRALIALGPLCDVADFGITIRLWNHQGFLADTNWNVLFSSSRLKSSNDCHWDQRGGFRQYWNN